MTSENQNVSFVGFVTRKDKDTGVNLLAKIVTPNKKRSLNKLVKVKVKANALDDYSCCVIDHATMKKIIEDSQDLEAVSESFQFSFNGEHGTTISYTIEKANDSSKIHDYLSDDGTLSGRPKYSSTGTADAVGYIRITVTKNDAEVSSRIMVRVKGMSADEVLNSDKIYSKYKTSLPEFLWDNIIIGTNNGLYSAKGHTEINDKLNFANTNEIPVPEISDTPIKCTWVIDYDEVGNFMKGDSTRFSGIYQLESGGGSRICMDKDDPNYGQIYKPSYKDACDYLRSSGFAELIETNSDQASNRRFRIGKTDPSAPIGKLRLRAKLTLGEEGEAQPVEVIYMCATVSKTMSTGEVSEFVQNVTQIGFNDVWQNYDENAIPIYVPAMSAGASGAVDQKISIFGLGRYKDLSSEQYKILDLKNNTLSNVIEFEGTPGIYKVTNESGTYKISKEPYSVTALFGSANFTEQAKNIDENNKIGDYVRILTIPTGTPSGSKTGLYKADEILNTSPDLTCFAVKYTLLIKRIGSGETEELIPFTKVFTLVRQP